MPASCSSRRSSRVCVVSAGLRRSPPRRYHGQGGSIGLRSACVAVALLPFQPAAVRQRQRRGPPIALPIRGHRRERRHRIEQVAVTAQFGSCPAHTGRAIFGSVAQLAFELGDMEVRGLIESERAQPAAQHRIAQRCRQFEPGAPRRRRRIDALHACQRPLCFLLDEIGSRSGPARCARSQRRHRTNARSVSAGSPLAGSCGAAACCCCWVFVQFSPCANAYSRSRVRGNSSSGRHGTRVQIRAARAFRQALRGRRRAAASAARFRSGRHAAQAQAPRERRLPANAA